MISLAGFGYAFVSLGHFPNYMKDPDPTSLLGPTFVMLHAFSFMAYLLGIVPNLIFHTITPLIRKERFSTYKTGVLTACFSLLYFLILKYGLSGQFLWLMD